MCNTDTLTQGGHKMKYLLPEAYCERMLKMFESLQPLINDKSLTESIVLKDSYEKITVLESILKNVLPKIPNGNFVTSSNRIVTLKKHFKYIMDGIFTCYQFGDVKFSKKEITEMKNLAILNFLIIWIENATNTKQNTNSFAKQSYAFTSEQTRHKRGKDMFEVDEKYRAKLNRSMEKLKNSYLLNKRNNKEKNSEHYHDLEKCVYNFIELCFAETYAKGELYLYKTLFINKEPFVNRHHESLKKDINKGYKDFSRFLNGILEENSDRIFVIKSLFLYKLELAYRWIFGAKLGQYMYDKGIDINKKIPDEINVFYNDRKNMGFINGVDISPFIKKYDSIIKYAYEGKLVENDMLKILAARFVIEGILAIYCNLFNSYIETEWTEKDFINAATFLKEEYKITEVFKQLNLNDYTCYETPSVYDYIKAVFLNLGLYDNELLNFSRDNMKNPENLIKDSDDD